MQLTGDGLIIGLQAGGLPDSSVLPGDLAQRMTLVSAISAAGQSAMDFGSIPSWVKSIRVSLNSLSTNDNSPYLLQLGDSGGIENTGYVSRAAGFGGTGASNTSGLMIVDAPLVGSQMSGVITLTLHNSTTNLWCSTGVLFDSAQTGNYSVGAKALSSVLDRLRVVSANGTATFDNGSVSILYQG